MPPPKLKIIRGPMAKDASEEQHEDSLAQHADDRAMHWAEQSTPLLGRRNKRNLSSDSEGS